MTDLNTCGSRDIYAG